MRRRRAGASRLPKAHAVSFFLGIAILFLALCSPIDAFSDQLAWVHMIQHTLLMMVAAPLMVYGSPGYVALWALPAGTWKPGESRTRRFAHSALSLSLKLSKMGRPVGIWISYALVLWVLHIPSLYEAALRNAVLHDFQHLAFFCSSFLFWRIALDPYFRRKLDPSAGILYLFIASIHAMVLGVLMAVSPRAWYPWYERTAPGLGLTAVQDQQLAGYIMWMPAGISFVVVAILLLTQLMRQGERSSHVA